MTGLIQYTFDPFPRNRVAIDFSKSPSKTRQSEAKECDINNIIQKWEKSGLVGHINTLTPQYIDATGIPDYQSALDLVIEAQSRFSSLPARVRDRFMNDPGRLLAFLADESNTAEAVSLGLVEPKTTPPASPLSFSLLYLILDKDETMPSVTPISLIA